MVLGLQQIKSVLRDKSSWMLWSICVPAVNVCIINMQVSFKATIARVLEQTDIKRLPERQGLDSENSEISGPAWLPSGTTLDRNWFVSTSSSLEIQAFCRRVSVFINFFLEIEISHYTYEAQSRENNTDSKLRGKRTLKINDQFLKGDPNTFLWGETRRHVVSTTFSHFSYSRNQRINWNENSLKKKKKDANHIAFRHSTCW